jgi:ATP-dependent DNA helicase DinG
MSLRFTPEAAAALRTAIVDARGAGGTAEVFAIGDVRDRHVCAVTITCRGQADAVIALVDRPQSGQAVIHNHPSGDLRPSDPDMALAGLYGDSGVGFVIVDDAVTRNNWVVEPYLREERRVDPDDVRAFFHERLKAILPDFEPRPGQVDMALGVADALSGRDAYVVEAGTGTGKSLAYLVPAALWALANQSKVVISTHTKALQGQLLATDLPLLQRAGLQVRAAVLQGRANYVCKRRLRIADAEEADPAARAELDALIDWEGTSETGSRSDLPIQLTEGLWERIESDSDLTLRVRCEHYEVCRFYSARRAAAAAHLIVVNHALLFADRAMLAEGAEAGIIPKYGRVILDEAHHLEDAATGAISERTTGRAIERAISGLLSYRRKKGALYRAMEIGQRRLDDDGKATVQEQAHVAAALVREVKDNARIAVADLAQTLGAIEAPVRLDDRTKLPGWNEAIPRAAWLVGALEATAGAIDTLQQLFEEVKLADTEMQPLLDLRRAKRRLSGHAAVVRGVFESEDAAHCRWIEPVRQPSQDAAIVRAPIEVAPVLRRLLWEPLPGNVCTSATLTVAGKFDYWGDRTGRSAEELRATLPSPFDHATQAILGLPRDLPEPGEGEFDDRTCDIVVDAVKLSGGGAFVLCTSYQAVKRYGAALRERLPSSIPVLTQGAGGRTSLLDRFRENPSSVLVGTDSFWEGVSVKGEGLRLVIIPKLPFRVPTEPLRVARIEAIQARGLDPFTVYSLPETAIRLRQGYGRLIRHRGDRGVVLLLDRRILSRWYGRVLLSSLPPARQVTGPWQRVRDEMQAFFELHFPTRLR